MALASVFVILGGLAQMFVTIIGGLAYPQILFPGMEVSSSSFDGVVNSYAFSMPELLLGVGGVGIALLMVAIAVKFLRFLPDSLADAMVDPHHKPMAAEASAELAGAAKAA